MLWFQGGLLVATIILGVKTGLILGTSWLNRRWLVLVSGIFGISLYCLVLTFGANQQMLVTFLDRCFFKNNDIDMFLAVQRELEAKGANALLVFSDSSNRKATFQDFFMPGGKRQVDFLIATVGFNFIYGQPEEGISK